MTPYPTYNKPMALRRELTPGQIASALICSVIGAAIVFACILMVLLVG